MKSSRVEALIAQVELTLLPELDIRSHNGNDPVEVKAVPDGWAVMGNGNYAVVFAHADFPNMVVKVYADGRPGLEDEAEVYRRLGRHPSFSECYYVGAAYLIMKRMPGYTLYDCLLEGIPIPPSVIRDVDEALAYAIKKGMSPRDIHGKNVMNDNGKGYVVDVSDFLLRGSDGIWEDFKRAYHWLYKPVLLRWNLPVPARLLEWCRKGYRFYRRNGKKRRLS
ncbi:serine/threonine protein kinase [Paenibacillus apiarius]|uniref:Serine/threonine protein kinase n=1 Tax=Paenibacillus apiarius TaxID=46240 RepID=A0ABT4DNT6_9BACL|nr:serine/threonine protein kinase [Paenibacillus apiarius]MBN3525318.1 serine/threonine protein kinase [Paenibacillus apiarius]MCY9512835.1 serine/threonine protein kinase [Paenibacillus apiarius]MCY9519021.1 serine/threonine protein kinase [Paenibacillus apiarius]MCY9550830.1 serine/threonine protein kinase [Paenibacillus apiarius]MCY9559736.1 serine/threonine protein kinase [Paenibacillus apiarius]